MDNIFLTGFMATGKTAIGEALARRSRRPFIDTDAEVERASGMNVVEIFRQRGEPAFRALEREALTAACHTRGAVVATGGGAVLDPANREAMRAVGRIVCLEASPEMVLARVGSADGRPLLAGAPDPLQRIRDLLAARAPAYADADLRIDTSTLTPEEIVERIVGWLGA